MLLAFYSIAITLALLVSAPFWLLRMATTGKYREGLPQRLGRVPRALRGYVKGKPVLWIHAVSVGEVLAASRLIQSLREQSGCAVVISTTTRTGQALARERFGADSVFYFPLDFAFAVRACLRALQPRMLVLLETEFWPRMLSECHRRHIPVAVVNARISNRSWPRYHRLRKLWQPLLRNFAAVLAQSEVDAQRMQALGAANAVATGNLKYDIRIAEPAPIVETIRRHLPSGAPVLVCGSTCAIGSESEEQILLSAFPADAVTLLAPRHPERFNAVAQILAVSGRTWYRRTTWAANPVPLAPGSILLLDTIGELAGLYAIATVAFVGGSLIPKGGHNPLEPAQFAVPVLTGPHVENFRGIVHTLLAENALTITPPENVSIAIANLFAHPQEARRMGMAAQKVCRREAGATDRAVATILNILRDQS
ncbi:MAG: 3-deoxy-D-manno-octulosonic acid transferase [Acidobacteriaceae bacterium]